MTQGFPIDNVPEQSGEVPNEDEATEIVQLLQEKNAEEESVRLATQDARLKLIEDMKSEGLGA